MVRRDLSAYRAVWLFALFDLPVDSPEARKRYAEFRRALLDEGFTMLQFSVYARYCGSEEAAESHRRRIRRILPEAGQVRMLSVTDRQFGRMEVYGSGIRRRPESPPGQLMLF